MNQKLGYESMNAYYSPRLLQRMILSIAKCHLCKCHLRICSVEIVMLEYLACRPFVKAPTPSKFKVHANLTCSLKTQKIPELREEQICLTWKTTHNSLPLPYI